MAGPGDYVLALVSAACLSGATAVAWSSSRGELSFDGEPFSRVELEGASSLRMRELAVGLHGAPGTVVLESGGTRLTVTGGEVSLEACPVRPGTTVRRKKGWLARCPEATVLRQACAWAPCEVRVDGRRVVPRVRELVRAFRFPGWEVEVACDCVSERSAPFAGVCGLAALGAAPEVVLVVHGVAYPQPDLGFPPGFCAWVADGELQRDLSRGALVQDARWKRCVGALHRHAVTLLIEEAEQGADLTLLEASYAWLLARQPKVAEQLPLFDLGSGERARLTEFAESHQVWGCCWGRMRMAPGAPRFPDGTPILLGSAPAPLVERFGPFAMVTGGEVPLPTFLPSGQRLVGERYLTRLQVGEVELGLPAREPEAGVRVTFYRGARPVPAGFSLEPTGRLPAGLHACVVGDSPEGAAAEVDAQVGALYQQLLHGEWEGEERRLAGLYLLEMLDRPAAVWVEQLVRMAWFPRASDGEWRSVLDLAEGDTADLTPRGREILARFLARMFPREDL